MKIRLFFTWIADVFRALQKDWKKYYRNHELWLQHTRNKGKILAEQKKLQTFQQDNCTHRKGGYIAENGASITNDGIGDYAVIKHTFPWGDTWVRCTRCQKWWKPGDKDYKIALKFPTQNQSSSSPQFYLPPKNLALARELTKDS